jgi:hypothetical protein
MEDFVKRFGCKLLLLCCVALLAVAGNVALGQQAPAQQSPANVAGNWTIYSKGADGKTATQHIELQQNGSAITGHFKGPYQSGGLEGTINLRHIVFHTKTREVLTFRGMVQGDRVQGVIEGTGITGTFHTRAGTGQWQASRSN